MTSNNTLIIDITLTSEAFILSVRQYSTFKVDTTIVLNFDFGSASTEAALWFGNLVVKCLI